MEQGEGFQHDEAVIPVLRVTLTVGTLAPVKEATDHLA
jgi:hypothetical protein